jgi:hypothetical protein
MHSKVFEACSIADSGAIVSCRDALGRDTIESLYGDIISINGPRAQ